MKQYIAKINAPKEKGYHGMIIANTKVGKYKGLNLDQFKKELSDKPITCFPFEVEEI
jgi:hypothetical protein